MTNPPNKDVAVTIDVTCWNVAPWIESCMASLFGQTFRDFEIVAVNDGSTDRTGEILSRLAANDTRLRVVQQENKGPGPARNTVLQLARGRFILFVDGDDMLAPDCLEKTYQLAAANDLDVVTFNWARIKNGNGMDKIIERSSEHESLDLNNLGALKQVFFSGRMSLMCWKQLVRSSLYRDHALFFPSAFHEDIYVTPFIYFYGKKFGYVDDLLYYWRIRKNSITRTSSTAHIDGILGAFISWKERLQAEGCWDRFRDTCIGGILFPHVVNLLDRIGKYENDDPILRHYLRAMVRSIPELEQYRRSFSPKEVRDNARLVALLEEKAAESTKKNKEPIVLWCGRFSQLCGYRTVSINHVKGLKELGLRVAMFDTQLMKCIDFDRNMFLQVTYGEDQVRIKAANPDDRIVVVIHENPNVFSFDRIRVDGLARAIGHTVFETDRPPGSWPKTMISMDELWVVSEFNRLGFESVGIPSFMLNKVHHSLDTELYRKDIGEIRFANNEAIEFLTVCTNMIRRDLGLALRSFYHSFSNDDSARLVIKLVGEAARPDSVSLIQSMIEEVVLSCEVPPPPPVDKIILVAREFSDEDMIRLYRGCDVYLSIERANGWDLPFMEAMACGKLCIGYYVGGSTEYREKSVSLSLPVMNETTPIPTPEYHPLYTGQVWPIVSETELVGAISKAKDAELRGRIGKAAKSRIARWFDIKVVSGNIRSLIQSYGATDYRSNYPAQIIIGKSTVWRTSSINPQAIDDLLASLLCHPSRGLFATRRFIRSLPKEDLADLIKGAKPDSITEALSKMLSTPWKHPLEKIMALRRFQRLSRHRMQTLESKVAQGLLGIYATNYSAARRITDSDIEARKRVSVAYPIIQTFASDRRALRSKHSRYQEKRCFIIGNGPSLNDLDLSKLAKEYTFGMNKIFLLYDRIDWRPSFYTLLDWRVGPSVVSHITELEDSVKFLPYRFRGYFPKNDSTYWFTTRPVLDNIDDQFSPDISTGIPSKGTILMTAIQIAFFLGFRDIYLIGADTSYTIPDNVLQSGPDRFKTGTKLYLESTEDNDLNHFDPAYFGKGAKWHDPNVDEMIRQYKNMKKGVEYHGGRIRNATSGGKLEVFERVAFDSLFPS